jgi:RNAse (barnase) inhibitor barstar
MKQELVIDGANFSALNDFYDEVERQLTKGLDWRIGRNLDAFNDVLRGGFGRHEYGEPILLRWKNSEKSGNDLGGPETILYLERMLTRCHPDNVPFVEENLEQAKQGKGETLFELILSIIRDHEHIELVLD